MMRALLLLITIVVQVGYASAQGPSQVQWTDPSHGLNVPQDQLQRYRNPDGCLAAESLVNTTKGPVRIDSLVPSRDAILYVADDGRLRSTHNYRSFISKQARTLVRIGDLRLTPEHRIAEHSGRLLRCGDSVSDYSYVPAERWATSVELLDSPVPVWDIENLEKCHADEGNFFAGGILVHNSCVQCSNGMCGLAMNVPEFASLLWKSEYGDAVRGGSNPSRVANYARARKVRIYNITGATTWDWMRWAASTGRPCAIGAGGSHFQTLKGYDKQRGIWLVVNNNGDQRIQEYDEAAFRRLHLASGQWCVILDYPPEPATPVIVEWWK